MNTVREIADAIARRTSPDLTPAWDPVGIQLGDGNAMVKSIGVCHEVTEDVVAALEESPVDLLVSYHPLLFAKVNQIRAGRSAEARAFRLIRAGVNLLVTHTDFDAADGGTADSLADAIGLDGVQPFGEDTDEGLPAIGRAGGFAGNLGELGSMVADVLGSSGLRVSGDPNTPLSAVAVVPGSGGGFVEAAADVADALLTGDVSHHNCVRALDLGLSIVDPGHSATERPGMVALVRMVRQVSDREVTDLTGFDPRPWI